MTTNYKSGSSKLKGIRLRSADGAASDITPLPPVYAPPAPPEGCFYEFDKMGNIIGMKCSDNPTDVYVAGISPAAIEPLPPVYAPTTFPNWDSLTCEQIKDAVYKLKEELTYIRVSQDTYDMYMTQIAYGNSLLSTKCVKSGIDDTIGIGDTGGIKTPIEPLPIESSGGGGFMGSPVGGGSGSGDGAPVAGKAPFKFTWWWAVAAGLGLYLLTKKD